VFQICNKKVLTQGSQKLRLEFCPPIDEPAFYSICSDHDLDNPESLNVCLSNLNFIKADALEADVSAFDASGTGGFTAKWGETSSESQSSNNGATSGSQEVDGITTGLSELGWYDASVEGQGMANANEGTKINKLKEMFPGFAEDKLSYRLRKCNQDLERAINELLNESFIVEDDSEERVEIPKGVDGFMGNEEHGRGRRGKGKRQGRLDDSTGSSSLTPETTEQIAPKNVWASTIDDVDFISARTNMGTRSIRSLYSANDRSLARTINALAVQEGSTFKSVETLDTLNQIKLAELSKDFPTLAPAQLYSLLVVSGNRISAAHELAGAMIAAPKPTSTGKLEVITKYAPLDLSSDVESGHSRSASPWDQISHAKAKNLALSKTATANTASVQASQAARGAKSNHLMGGAVAHYASVRDENVKAAKALSSIAADAHVSSQSTPTRLDLHGVSVADAVRITKQQVLVWWHNLGDAKYARGGGGPMREGYQVVTGVGRHSKHGTPKIGPAVYRMLVREGWKATVERGEILVTGKARRS
jgi:CUE domain